MSQTEAETRLLIEIGKALYGERWQTSLANDLQVADRTMRRWVSGASPIPPALWSEIDEILAKHADSIGSARRKIAGRETQGSDDERAPC
jgi:hypothetical protein